ncbi:nucleolar 4-like isoform X1 [Brachionus plicatilis]|uniref:Nucleolar 4-like isoform X1 n=1 Tax=Brachionus plicatilis TaxID=10195 RepID=A0A3M7SL37_BRAPC|nr:nucleolar 4-like isoform X1 [Brachionus plicatilis]
MNEKIDNENSDSFKNSFYSISKIMSEKQDDSNMDEDNGPGLRIDKEADSELNDSINSENSSETDLSEYLKSLINNNLSDLNNSREDFDRLARQILDKSLKKFSTIGKSFLIKTAKKVFSIYEFDHSLSDLDLNICQAESKPSRASSSSGYNSIPSPSSSSSSASSQKHSIKADTKSSHKKIKTSTDIPKASMFDFKTQPSKSSPAANSSYSPFSTWNPGLIDPEFLRLAANSNPLIRFPDFSSLPTNPYLNNFNSFSNFFKPNFPSTQSFVPPTGTKKEIPQESKQQQNGNKTISTQSMRIQTSKNENTLTSSLASSKFKLSSKLSKLSSSEIQTVKSLINSYRESAAFLSRSADELEQIINEISEN